MPHYQFTIRPTSPWITPLRSDTLHGLMLCMVAQFEGEKAVDALLHEFEEGKNPFAFSSAMPEGFLPKPCLPPIKRAVFQEKFKTDLVGNLHDYKKFNKLSHIPLHVFTKYWDKLSQIELFMHYLANKDMWNTGKKNKKGEWEKPTTLFQMHNTINRTTATTLQEGGLFSKKATAFPQDYTFTLYAEGEKTFLAKYLTCVGELGFGADASTGKGRFTVVSCEESPLFTSSTAPYLLTLGVLAGENMSTLDGYYKTFTKKGRAWAAKSGVSPFKKPFLALNEGAVLKTLPQNCMLKGLHENTSLVQLCHTLTLPAGIKE